MRINRGAKLLHPLPTLPSTLVSTSQRILHSRKLLGEIPTILLIAEGIILLNPSHLETQACHSVHTSHSTLALLLLLSLILRHSLPQHRTIIAELLHVFRITLSTRHLLATVLLLLLLLLHGLLLYLLCLLLSEQVDLLLHWLL